MDMYFYDVRSYFVTRRQGEAGNGDIEIKFEILKRNSALFSSLLFTCAVIGYLVVDAVLPDDAQTKAAMNQ
jgi:hypothetical protein